MLCCFTMLRQWTKYSNVLFCNTLRHQPPVGSYEHTGEMRSQKHVAGVLFVTLTFSLSSGSELWPSPYSCAYCCQISASLLWREVTLPRSSFRMERTAPACSPWLSVRFSTTARTRICRICRGINKWYRCQWQIQFILYITSHYSLIINVTGHSLSHTFMGQWIICDMQFFHYCL